MTLLRSFREVDKDGRVALGSNFMTQMGLEPNSAVGVKVMRITGSVRYPYLFVHRPENEPRFSALETDIHQSLCRIDDQGRIVLDDKIMAESGFEPGLSLEFKLAGPTNGPWLAIRNKGPTKLTALQEKMGLKRKNKWKVMEIEY